MKQDDASNMGWDELTRLAREAQAPEIDVSAGVMSAIRALPRPVAIAPASTMDLLAAMSGSVRLRGALAVLTVAAALVGYHGLENSEIVSLLLGFSF